jgi:acyl-CoA synthetase (AMP-forming)/AMP-acid ligase II
MVVAIVTSPIPVATKVKYLRFVKAALAGAAPLDKAMQARFQALLPASSPFTQIWAMTETSCFASIFYYPEDDDTGSVGRFVPNLDVKLLDEEDKEIHGFNKTGELCIRGPTVICGYLGAPEANARDFDREGYFHTGDIMYCDEKTKLWYIVDRKKVCFPPYHFILGHLANVMFKELIKVRGFQVAPAELEGALLDHPEIIDAAVIGIPVPKDESEIPRAYVVLKPGAKLSEDQVKRYMEERLAKYKRLDGGVKFVASIPKTPSGKILKRVLREEVKLETVAKANL